MIIGYVSNIKNTVPKILSISIRVRKLHVYYTFVPSVYLIEEKKRILTQYHEISRL